MFRFTDHRSAGELLATLLEDYADRSNVVVLALRTPANEVALAVAEALKCPFAFEFPPVTPALALEGATIILVDDGFATARELDDLAAEARVYRPAHLIAAAPIASPEAAASARNSVDGYAFLATPAPFHSVRFWYEDSAPSHASLVHGAAPHGVARSISARLMTCQPALGPAPTA